MTSVHTNDRAGSDPGVDGSTGPSLAGTTAVVTGASGGFGRAITVALIDAGVRVVGVARTVERLQDLATQFGDRFVPVVADATHADVCGDVIETYRPRTLVLNAGAATVNLPLPDQSWSTFSRNWDVDVRHAFEWTRAALRRPLEPSSRVLSISSGAALRGSPLSGGYAGAKATVRFISSYAAEESDRAGLGIGFTSLLPQLTPATGFGATAVAAYASRQGIPLDEYTAALGATLTTDQVAAAVVDLCRPRRGNGESFLLTAAGVSVIGG